MQRFIFQGAHFFSFIFVLSLIIFLSGCGGGGSSWDTSYNNGISPSSNKTPQAVLDKAKQENASKGGRAESSPIVLQAGTTATILAYSADAGTTSSFGIYQPEEKTLTGDTNHAIGQTWTVGPFSEDKNLAFWFQSGVSPSDSKIQLTPSGEGAYYIGCEDLTDNDYNDFVAQVTVKSTSQLSIKDAKATPEEFTPGKKEENNKTNITAQIVANSSIQVDSIQWQVTIKDESDATVKTFETRTGTAGSGPWDVSETWDGKNDAGDYVDYGKYSFKISATATSNGTEKKADAVGSVQVAPQYPTLTKLTFENTLDIKYDDGENVKPIYYKAKDTDITQNPFAIPLSRLTPVDSDKVKGKCNITLEIPNKPVKAISFEVRIKSHSDTVIVEKEYITFDGNKKESSKDVDFTVPSKIQTIKGVVVEYRIVKNEDGNWVSKSDWKEDATAKPKENIWITLDEPKDPLGEHGKDKVRTGMLEIACDLDNVILPEEERLKMAYAKSSPTASEIIKTTLIRVHDYLGYAGFTYNDKATHSSVIMRKKEGKKVAVGTKFNYTLFKKDIGTSEFQGDCQDVSNLYALCCGALGADMKLRRLTFGEGQTAETRDFIELINRPPQMWPFQMHQTGGFQDLIYDPLIKVQNKYIIGIIPGDYQGNLNDYIDVVFKRILAPPGTAKVIWSEELPLLEYE